MRVIVVDDDDNNRRLLEEAAALRACAVIPCRDLADAWTAFLEDPRCLILLDWVMGEDGGLEFCRRVRRHERGLQCVIAIITVRDEPANLQAVLAAGADDYLAKPIDFQLFDVRLSIAQQRLRDIEERERVESALRESERRLRRHNQALTELTQRHHQTEFDMQDELRAILETGAQTLDAARVTMWLYNAERDRLCCVSEFDRVKGVLAGGQELKIADYPNYCRAIEHQRTLAVTDALQDERTKEFAEAYLIPNQVRSMLDAPIRRDNQVVGVVCVDHRGSIREWTLEEQQFAGSLADFSALILEVAERLRAQTELEESRQRYVLAARGANDGLWDWDLKSDNVYFSPRWKRIVGCEEDDIGSSPQEWFDRVHPEDREQIRALLGHHLEGQSPHFESEYRIFHKDGSYRWVLCRGLAVRDSGGKAHRVAGSQTDITERKRALEQLLHDAFHDVLTGLPNRALCLDRLAGAVGRAKRRNRYLFCVMVLGLDRFKIVNDSLGHRIADQLLRAVGRRLESCLRPGDTVARLGGDEFAILLDELQDVSEPTKVARRIHDELANPFEFAGQEVFVSASVGIALSGPDSIRSEDILRNAQTAMYRAKSLGKARSEVFDSAMQNRAVARLKLETDLRRAIDRRQFVVYYQPIVQLDTGRISSFEALVRWQHPERGLVSPVEFIPVAEETGMIISIGQWVLSEAWRQINVWRQRYAEHKNLSVSVNLSGKQLSQPGLLEFIRTLVKETPKDEVGLRLEITESVMMDNAPELVPLLNDLRDLNVQMQIDDFGTGYSSLSYLHQFPIDSLKIDRAFVSNMNGGGTNLEIVRTIITLAQTLGLDVIAEGVETEQQANHLRTLNCEMAQGFLFSRPVASESAEELLAKNVSWSHS